MPGPGAGRPGGGLTLVQPEFSETDFTREWTQLVNPAGPSWMRSNGRWTSGVLAGSTQTNKMAATEIECSTALLPLERGKEGTIRFAYSNLTAAAAMRRSARAPRP